MTETIDRPWIIRKSSGQMYSCPDLKTLKKWIAEGRLRREDQISQRGDRWFRLGDSPELSRCFASYPVVPRAKSREHSLARQRKLGDITLDGMVKRFTWKRRARGAVLSLAGVSLVAIALGASFAMIGPARNPLRAFLEQHGILPGKILAERAFAHHTEIAHAAWSRGDITDHARAEELLSKAAKLRADNAEVTANLALVYASHADALLRIAADEERDAKAFDAEAKEKLQKTAASRHRLAGELVVKAKEAASHAEQLAPDTVPTLRAVVEVSRVSGDDVRLDAARAQLEKECALPGKEDAWSYAVLARADAPDPERADTQANALAVERLEKAIKLDPSLDRCRVQLARIHAARGSLADAERELSQVLGVMPSYEEAQRLMGRVRAEIAQGDEAGVGQKGA